MTMFRSNKSISTVYHGGKDLNITLLLKTRIMKVYSVTITKLCMKEASPKSMATGSTQEIATAMTMS